jgi:hypothetical protein
MTVATLSSYRINPARSSGFIAANNAIMTPSAKPTIVPAATPRQSIFVRRLSFHISNGYRHPTATLGQTTVPY